ncbi:hypothetical protein BMS3Bbin06_00640 [bacterium BMS3Bbin06]|nr:hypothetical protein BMS3Abin08_01173 [bacterium BMS3Abin08]GBE34121.1 hypothetical protein BMS3Bbin06_00640 [bacterium BMS3Bbin06]
MGVLGSGPNLEGAMRYRSDGYITEEYQENMKKI